MRSVDFVFLDANDTYMEVIDMDKPALFRKCMWRDAAVGSQWASLIQGRMTENGLFVCTDSGEPVDGKLFFPLPWGLLTARYFRAFGKKPRVFNGTFDVTQVIRARIELRERGRGRWIHRN